MKIFTKTMTGMGTVAVAAAIGVAGAGIASASPVTGTLGTPERLMDANGAIVSSYTVTDLQPSNDIVTVPLAGHLWEATTTVNAEQGTVTPAIPFFNARAADGQNYRVLFQAIAPEGIKAQPLNPGGTSTGKIYFDVTGPAPTQVVYNDAVQDRLVWAT
jgi:hypothetical protein